MAADPLERFLLMRRPRADSRVALRPMSSSEVVDSSLRIYQSLGKLILRLTAIPSLFTFAGLAFLGFVLMPMLSVTNSPDNTSAQVIEALATLAISLGVALPIMSIGFSLTTGIVVRLVADYVNGSVPDESGAVRGAVQAMKRMVWLNLYEAFVAFSCIIVSAILLMVSALLDSSTSSADVYAGAIVAIAMFGFLIGGIVFLAVLGRHAIAPAIVMLEGAKAVPAAKRSVALMRGNKTHPSGYNVIVNLCSILFLVALILWPAIGATFALFDLAQGIRSTTSTSIVGSLLLQLLAVSPIYIFLWVIIPVWSTTITVTYFERRIRLEGIDVESLARAMVRSRKEIRFEL